MRPILMLALSGTLMLLPVVSFAETNAECTTRCAAENASRDESCPPSDEADRAHSECLRENQEGHSSCVAGCPQPEPPDAPPAEN